MNYSPLLDSYFSNPFLFVGIPAILFFGCIILGMRSMDKKRKALGADAKKQTRTKKEKRKSGFYTFLLVAFPIAMMMLHGDFNQSWLGYGKSKRNTDIKYINGKLYVVDYLRTMGGKTSSGIRYYRLHIVDPVTGKKERRILVGPGAELEFVVGDLAFVSHYADLWCFNTKTGKRTDKFNKKTLPGMFTQLASGLDNFSFSSSTRMITAEGKDGMTWYIDPVTRSIVDSLPKSPKYAANDSLFLDNGDLVINSDYSGDDYIDVESKYSSNKGKREQIYDRNDSLMYKNESFIDGSIPAFSLTDSSFIVLHYETTEDLKFILSCYKMNGSKKLWEIKQNDLHPDFKFKSYKERPHFTTDVNGEKLFFGIGGEIFCVDMKDGKVIWKTQL
jgi:hypothetical protein